MQAAVHPVESEAIRQQRRQKAKENLEQRVLELFRESKEKQIPAVSKITEEMLVQRFETYLLEDLLSLQRKLRVIIDEFKSLEQK